MASVTKESKKNARGETVVRYRVRHLAGGKHLQKTFARSKDAVAFKARVELVH